MTKQILLFAFSLIVATTYAASELFIDPVVAVTLADEGRKVEVDIAKLPVSVAASMNETHKEVSISKAYQVEGTDHQVTGYEVIVNSGDVEETLKFDASGAWLK